MLTWHNDQARTGQNLAETVLTPLDISETTVFGKLFTIPVDGKVDAQPLYVPSLTMGSQGTHNVLYVMTENDSAYAFDADTGSQLWHVTVTLAGETPSDNRGCSQVTPIIGITSTPVIDLQSGPHGTLYLVAMSKDALGNYYQRLHALDLTTGAEEFGGPKLITATWPGTGTEGANGTQVFDPKQHKERAALLLANGVLYTSWSSHCDDGPYTGWVMGYSESTLAQVSLINLTPNGDDGALWGAGAGPAVDASGNIYVMTANGTFDTTLNGSGFPSSADYGNAFVRLVPQNGSLSVADYFTMYNTVSESDADEDLGSGGLLLLPPVTDAQGHTRNLLVGAGKDDNIYVVDRDNMGKFNTTQNLNYQDLAGAIGGVWSSPAWFNGTLYYGAVSDYVKAFAFNNGSLSANPTSQSPTAFAYPGATPSISANGTVNAIVWAAENTDPATLHAYDATNLGTELYNSNTAANGRDNFGTGNKFIVPTIANGKVYVGTTAGVGVFGLFCSGTLSPNTNPAAAGGGGTVTVTASASCNWTAQSNAPWLAIISSSAAGSGTVNYSVAANTSTSSRIGTLTIAGQTFTVTQAGAASGNPATVTAVSVTPASGSGSTASLTATYSDTAGYTDLAWTLLLVNSSLNGSGACYVAYQSGSNSFYLANDTGTGWMSTSIPAGSSGSVQNSQCTLNGTGSSVTGSGNNLSMTVSITFLSGFTGAKTVYLYGLSAGGQNSGWQSRGTWTAPGNPTTVTAVSVSPTSGSGSTASLTATYGDTAGYTDLAWTLLLVNSSLNGSGACYVAYQSGSNSFFLANDTGTGWMSTSVPAGSSGSVANGQCTLNGTGSSVSGSGNNLSMTVSITFLSGFTGAKTVYLYGLSAAGQNSGWQSRGTWTAPGNPATVTAVSVTPTSGSGSTASLTATYGNTAGYTDLAWTLLLVNSSLNGSGACYVAYQQGSNSFYLANDTGTGWMPTSVPAESSGNVQNSQCTLNGTGSSVSGSGNRLSMTVSMTFLSGFTGAKTVYLYGLSAGGQNSGWQSRGAWTAQ